MLLFGPNTLSFQLLSKNLKIKICKTVILPVVPYACETWSPTLSEGIKKMILGRIFGPRGMRLGTGQGSIIRNFMVCTIHLI